MSGFSNKYPDPNKPAVVLATPAYEEGENGLWSSLRSGSREALNKIFEKYGRVLYSYGRNMTVDQGLIADCIQDIFVELWSKRSTVAAHVHSIKSYLIKSLRRRILRRLAENKRFAGTNLPEGFFEEAEFNIELRMVRDLVSAERAKQLQASIATLSRRQQEAIYLRFHENMRYEDIASVLNTDVKAVYNLVGRAIATLRRFFEVHPISAE